ncbi:MAG: 50S ribosomal protein L9 [Thermodesulfobacterium sp. 37_54]|jgi:large subunit ribosomal protein L9|uniref:50S ribosomal protein L9 n=1 Tax=Thermodesulfobacterium TaxID=1740 RepID=UPI0007497572|nr:50S ribosomal protein L9 [Thermodesulfobacterium sp.]KUJ97035.1 MAG: 50S ribosomal protein L9 [Thermodesulfobacterium sp. 37_54]KUK18787.1 MAG: 50S ribosomal protein L9 [Thermodesulfobacterium commune]KUK38061.1 MAG: 50S ribosomal protein L9 [Thermodesulfobacterium commune]MDN5379407.1 large subunit ribosomal protein [Thermodesulfobacterium sp.]HBT03945.1 50S ribosomal protein L9 [Thermodesulfobacterium commune]
MEVILRTDVPKLGKAGDIVKVKDGYARNYLIPKGFAIPANQKNIKALEKERQIILAKAERERKKLMSLAEKLEGLELVIYRRKIEEDRIFGSVTVADIVSALKEKGFEVDKKFIELDQPIKKLGVYEIPVKFSPDRVVTIKLEVIEEK